MNLKTLKLMSVLSILLIQGVWAQTTVSGRVTSSNDEAGLLGVNIIEQGTTNGTVTDLDGSYSINVSDPDAVLVFSFVGFSAKEIPVNGQQVINVALDESRESLDEVVVTALGIERERKALGYAVTQLEGESVSAVKTPNAINALQGKVAGVNITPPATGAGGTSRVVIRGASSISPFSDNQPLYVVDGAIIDNTQLGAASQWGGSDFGDGISSINPDDIEKVSVLKGGAAAALYGSGASNGVILITTKNGKGQQGLGVEFNSQVMLDNVRSNILDLQDQYGQGQFGQAPVSQQEASNTNLQSWGAPLGSVANAVQFDGVERPYRSTGNNLDRFYNTGITYINTLGITKGSQDFNYRFGVTTFNNQGIVPDSDLDRKTFSLNLGSTALDKLTVNLSARYSVEGVNNRPRVSDSPGNANFSTALLAPNVNVLDLAPGSNPDGTELQVDGSNPFIQNPYWAARRWNIEDGRNRFIGNATLNYQVLDWLDVTARLGLDFSSNETTQIEGYGTAFLPLGQISERTANISRLDSDIILGINKTFSDKYGVKAYFGANRNNRRTLATNLSGNNFSVPFVEIFNNVENVTVNSRNEIELATSSVYGSVELSYDDMLFLTATGRNDWFSTLSAADKTTANNDFYPSISGSFVFSKLFKPDWLSFGTFRVGYSEVAGGADTPYQLSQTYQIFGSQQGQPLGQITPGALANPLITPFNKSEIEVGLDMSMFDGRFGIDLAYYNNETSDDILPVDISNASGYNNVVTNIGVVSNEGVEVLLRGKPISNDNFSWNTSFNIGFNESLVEKTDDSDNPVTTGLVRTFAANISQIPGQRFGVIFGRPYLRDENGQIVYNDNGTPVNNAPFKVLGNGVPPWTVGFSNTFRYKDFNLSFLVDGKFGGEIYSGTNANLISRGLHKRTLNGREGGLTVTGVDTNGDPFTFTHDDTTLSTYYGVLSTIAEETIESSDFLKLRQLSFGYSLPSKLLNNIFIKSLDVSIIGRDLLFLHRAAENIDPESAFNAGNAQGLEFFGLPSTSSIGMNINLKF